MYEIKLYRRVTCHENAKIEEELTCQFKTHLRNLTNLTQAFKNLKNLHFHGLFLNKIYIVWAKKSTVGVMFDGTEYWCNIWRKTDLCFKNDMRNLANFHQSMFGSLKIVTLMYELKIYRGVLRHDNEEWYKIWREIDLPYIIFELKKV